MGSRVSTVIDAAVPIFLLVVLIGAEYWKILGVAMVLGVIYGVAKFFGQSSQASAPEALAEVNQTLQQK